jgi:hypothetical protein
MDTENKNDTETASDKGVASSDLLDGWQQSTDASVWAKAFMEHKERNEWNLEDIDEGLMLAWFAYAMIAMHDSISSNGEM